MASRALRILSVGCVLFLLAGCDETGGGGGSSSSSSSDSYVVECRQVMNGVDLMRSPIVFYELPEEKLILTIRVVNAKWNDLERVVKRVGDESIARVRLVRWITTQHTDGTIEKRCVNSLRHIEVRGNYVFENVVRFVVDTLIVSQPCTEGEVIIIPPPPSSSSSSQSS